MTMNELAADILRGNLALLTRTIADFSDADLMVRPVPGANHATWQIGQVISSESRMGKAIKPELAVELPAGFAELFTKETASIDDPAKFPKKAALLEQFTRTREATIAIAKSLSDTDFAAPSPPRLAGMAPTVGHVIFALAPGHLMMHIGQIQVIRRKLGKPILM